MQTRTVLVTGATGQVGRHVVRELQHLKIAVRALTRNPRAVPLSDGVTPVVGDLAAPETLDEPLRGVDAVFLLWPFFSVEAAPAVLAKIAERARHVVYLSAASVRDDVDEQPGLFHADIERLIRRTELSWTFLRPTGFASNTLMWAPQIRAGDVVRWPYGAASRSLIHEKDIASVAAHALTGEGHERKKYVLTGPETVTQVEQVSLIGQALGRALRYEELSPEAARKELLDAWGNPSFVDAALSGWAAMVSAPEPVTSTVVDVTKKPARPFQEWAVDHAEDFR